MNIVRPRTACLPANAIRTGECSSSGAYGRNPFAMIVASEYVPGFGGASSNTPSFPLLIVVAPPLDVNVISASGTPSLVDQLTTRPLMTPPSASTGSMNTRPCPGTGSGLFEPDSGPAGSTTILPLPAAEPFPGTLLVATVESVFESPAPRIL